MEPGLPDMPRSEGLGTSGAITTTLPNRMAGLGDGMSKALPKAIRKGGKEGRMRYRP